MENVNSSLDNNHHGKVDKDCRKWALELANWVEVLKLSEAESNK